MYVNTLLPCLLRYISDFFFSLSPSQHHGCRYVHWSQLKNILEAFDQRLNVERVFTVLKQYDPSLSKGKSQVTKF